MLRHSGIRVEELLQLTDHSLVQYRLPSTGELGPLLQFASSKTDAERLLISPELADVFSARSSAASAAQRNSPIGESSRQPRTDMDATRPHYCPSTPSG